MRNPMILFTVGSFIVFVGTHRFWSPISGKRERNSVIWTNFALAGIIGWLVILIGWEAFLLVEVPILLIACSAGVWLFYVQHNFEPTYWERHARWDFFNAGMDAFLRTATLSRQAQVHMRSYLAAALVATGLVAGCSFDSVVGVVDPYRIDVRQGNYVDQEMLSQLRRGMSRDQVRYVLGSPLVVDMFRTDRWDYVYSLRSARKEAEQRVISVYFEGDVLDRVEGDVESAQSGEGGEGAAAAAGARSRVVETPAVEAR